MATSDSTFPATRPGDWWFLVPVSFAQICLAAHLCLSLVLHSLAKSIRASILPIYSFVRVSVTVAYTKES